MNKLDEIRKIIKDAYKTDKIPDDPYVGEADVLDEIEKVVGLKDLWRG